MRHERFRILFAISRASPSLESTFQAAFSTSHPLTSLPSLPPLPRSAGAPRHMPKPEAELDGEDRFLSMSKQKHGSIAPVLDLHRERRVPRCLNIMRFHQISFFQIQQRGFL